MLEALFVRLLEISVTTSIIILGLRLLAPYLNKTYAAKWKYWIWLLLAVRLIIPVNISLPTAPLSVNIPNTPIDTLDNVMPYPAPDVAIVQPGAVTVQPEQIQPLTETAQMTITLLDAITMIWVIGIIAFLVYQMTGYFIFKKKALRWSRTPQDPRIESTIHLASSQIGLSKRVIPLISDTVSSPLMIGFFRPLLVLPCETYSDADLSFIVRHELTHCKRNDLWYKLLLIIANAVHWFNPVVYLMFHEASGDLELSCDDVITNGMSYVERKVYTETILASIQRERMKKTALSTYFYGGRRTIKNRFINILNTGKKRRGAFSLLAVLLFTALVGGLIACTADAGNNSADSVITKYLEAEKTKDYVISLSIEKVEISNEETARIKERYSGSELANTNGWTDEYIAENMIAVYAKYTVDYDNTKVPYNEGVLEQYFYLTRADKNAEWTMWDNTSPSDGTIIINNPTESTSRLEPSSEPSEKSVAEILGDLANQEFSIKEDQISDDDYKTIVTLGKAFVNLYTGAVAEQETVSFENYISNNNLLRFTDKMLELTQKQELSGRNAVNYGLENEFKEVEYKKLDENLCYLKIPFQFLGSGMTCQLLVQSENKSLKIVDLYFGNKDGVDTIATGHPANRKVDNPKLWDNEEWVQSVFEKLQKYESDLNS